MIEKYLPFYIGAKVVLHEGNLLVMDYEFAKVWDRDGFQLALRPVPDLKDYEINALDAKFKNSDADSISIQALIFANLLQMRVDIFDLISQGLAKDITKL